VTSLEIPPDLTKPNYENSFRLSEFVKDIDSNTISLSDRENTDLEIKEILNEFPVQVVSVPILNKLNPEISESLNNNKLTFTLELGKAVGWSDYIGNITESFSIQTFGKSAPEMDLAKYFKVNADFIVKEIRSYLD